MQNNNKLYLTPVTEVHVLNNSYLMAMPGTGGAPEPGS